MINFVFRSVLVYAIVAYGLWKWLNFLVLLHYEIEALTKARKHNRQQRIKNKGSLQNFESRVTCYVSIKFTGVEDAFSCDYKQKYRASLL